MRELHELRAGKGGIAVRSPKWFSMTVSRRARLVGLPSLLACAMLLATAGASADTTPTCFGESATISGSGTVAGTPGNDVIVGSPGSDTIDGAGGNDLVCGLDGDDALVGGPGNDRVDGGPGTDIVVGDRFASKGDMTPPTQQITRGGFGVCDRDAVSDHHALGADEHLLD